MIEKHPKKVLCECGKFVTFRWKKCRKDVALTESFRTNILNERRYPRVETFEVVTEDYLTYMEHNDCGKCG